MAEEAQARQADIIAICSHTSHAGGVFVIVQRVARMQRSQIRILQRADLSLTILRRIGLAAASKLR